MGAYLSKDKLQGFLDKGVCREERQFSALLYYMFLEVKKGKKENENIIKRCLKIDNDSDMTIKDVYYEPTLMRDFFENDRDFFNKALIKFCLGEDDTEEISYDVLKRNLGQSRAKEIIRKFVWTEGDGETVNKMLKDKRKYREFIKGKIKEGKCLDKVKKQVCFNIAGMMMNAIPDLLIIYENNGRIYAKMLECKYSSDEGLYEDVAGIRCKMQFFIQECIMKFCFGQREGINISKIVKGTMPFFSGKKGNVWSNEELWEENCGKVYESILSRKEESGNNISNGGVMLIKFEKEKEREKWEKENQEGVFVSIDDELMRAYNLL